MPGRGGRVAGGRRWAGAIRYDALMASPVARARRTPSWGGAGLCQRQALAIPLISDGASNQGLAGRFDVMSTPEVPSRSLHAFKGHVYDAEWDNPARELDDCGQRQRREALRRRHFQRALCCTSAAIIAINKI